MPDISLDKIYEAESRYVGNRRESAKTNTTQQSPNPGQASNDLVGLAISGGGIRSATFSLGVIQALEEKDVLRHVDYLSTVSGGGYTGSLLSANLYDKTGNKNPTPIKRTPGQQEPPVLRHLRDGSNYLAPGGARGLLKLFGPITFKLFHTIVYLISFLLIATIGTELIHENLIGPQSVRLPDLSLSWPLTIGLLVAGCLLAATTHFPLNWKNREFLERGMSWGLMTFIACALLIPIFSLITSAIELPLKELQLIIQNKKWTLIWSTCAIITLVGLGVFRARGDLTKWSNHLLLYFFTLSGPAFLFGLYLLLCVAQVDSAFIQAKELASELSKGYTTKPEFFPISDKLRDQLEARGIYYLGDGDIRVPMIYLPPQKTDTPESAQSWLIARPVSDSLAPPSKTTLESVLAANTVQPNLHNSTRVEINLPQPPTQTSLPNEPIWPLIRDILQVAGSTPSSSTQKISVENRTIDKYFFRLRQVVSTEVDGGAQIEISHYGDAQSDSVSIEQFSLRTPLNLSEDVPYQIFEGTVSSELRDSMASKNRHSPIRYKVSNDVRVKSFFHGPTESTERYWITKPNEFSSNELDEIKDKNFLQAREAFFDQGGKHMDRWTPIDQPNDSRLYELIDTLYKKSGETEQIKLFARANLPTEITSLLAEKNPTYENEKKVALIYSPEQKLGATVYLRRTREQRKGDIFQEFLFKSPYHVMVSDTEIRNSDYFRLKKMGESDIFEIVGAGLQFFSFSDIDRSIALIQEENNAEWLTDLEFLGITTVLVLICFFVLNPNQSSLLYSYRDRLSHLYLVRPKNTNSVEHRDTIRLTSINGTDSIAPYHILNATLNMGASYERGIRGRKSDFFIFSKLFCGSKYAGYCETGSLEKKDVRLNLGTAMAISAAAAAPNMGAVTIRPLVFAMTMLNIRLSYWLPNPKFINRPKTRKHNLHMWYLIREAMGWLTEKKPFINLSDGGHIENLGLYELIRRKVKYIIAIDGECDPALECTSLVRLIRYARIDHGVEISFPEGLKTLKPSAVQGENASPYSQKSWLLGKIDYGTVNGEPHYGHLIYIKATCPENEGPVLRQYRTQSSSFPHETTADQFFTEDQFEAYRELGELISQQVIQDLVERESQAKDEAEFDSFPFLPQKDVA